MGPCIRILLTLDLLLCSTLQIMVKGYESDDLSSEPSASSEDGGEGKLSVLETGISDVKSIIMEKYGRHYRLTGGSMLATKRNKPDIVTIDATSSENTNASTAPVENKTVDIMPSRSNVTVSNISNSNNSRQNESAPGKSDIIAAASKSNIVNAGETNSTRDKVVHLNSTQPDNSTVQFGHPPEPDKPIADGENNYTSEGNLTTINIDLTKSDSTTAILPNLDLRNNPISHVDIVYGNETNTPKRSGGTSSIKPKKNIVFQMSKPRMSINDFANKRKHVPHAKKLMAKKRACISRIKKSKKGRKRSCHQTRIVGSIAY